MQYKVSVISRNAEGCWVSIQQNQNGQFGKTEKMFFSSEQIGDLSWMDFLKVIDDVLNCREPEQKSEDVAPQDIGELHSIPLESHNREIFQTFTRWVKINSTRIIVGIIMLCFASLVGLMSMSGGSSYASEPVVNPQMEIEALSGEIAQLRAEREQSYNQCTSLCNADRAIYDAEVTIRKSKIIQKNAFLLPSVGSGAKNNN